MYRLQSRAVKNNNVVSLIKSHFTSLDEDQLKAIQTISGPLSIIAGPGSGKTLVLALRALYLIFIEEASPCEIIMTTFTEKAAFELRDRIHQYGTRLGYDGPIHEIKIGTINSLCDQIIRRFIHYTPLKKNYQLLDGLTQSLFIVNNFNRIIPERMKVNDKYFGRWLSKWQAVDGIVPYFNRITEELIDLEKLVETKNPFLLRLTEAYQNYQRCLYTTNRIDFAHEEKIIYQLLVSGKFEQKIKQDVKYIMIDEYQDTNFIQEQILLQLALPDNNMCVVGDEDQSLYGFRGATVRNIIEFRSRFPSSQSICLHINYRSHQRIVRVCNDLMRSINWSDSSTRENFRFDKTIKPDPSAVFPKYPAVFSIIGNDAAAEGDMVAQVIRYLKGMNIITDYGQVALLLHSVKIEYCAHYLQAFSKYSIPYHVRRAKSFFDNEEVRLMIGCYAVLFGFQEGVTISYGAAGYFDDLRSYMYGSLSMAKRYFRSIPTLMQFIHKRGSEIADLDSRKTLDMRIIDYLYELLGLEPFSKFLDEQRKAKNLAIFSQLLTLFQSYYRIDVVTQRNRLYVREKLFADFLAFLIKHGVDNHDDYNSDSIIHDQVQVMTIHQSKGLQFPVVIVGSLNHKRYASTAQIDRELGTFYYRPPFEPDGRIAEFHYVRECYVAFSRAENLLVLTTTGGVNAPVKEIFRGLNQWPELNKYNLYKFKTAAKKQFFQKKSYSVTSDVNVFEVCPAQYRFYKEDNFSPSRSANTTFGILVHQTIEDIHKEVLAGRLGKITNEMIVGEWFKVNYDGLLAQGMRPLSVEKKYLAVDHILDYFNQNYDNLERIVEAEVDVSVEKHDYILTGRIDLLLGGDGQLEILDFKTQQRPIDADSILQKLYLQLCIYAHILREKYHKNPTRAYVYWTGQRDRDSAMMEFRLKEDDIISSIYYFDGIVDRIKRGEFRVEKPPATKVCMECDFRKYCRSQGVINV